MRNRLKQLRLHPAVLQFPRFAAIVIVTCGLAIGSGLIATQSAGPRAPSVIEVKTTNTQALIRFQPPSALPCTIVVSDSPTMRNVAYDVDGTLFPGEQLDSRPSTILNGQQRTLVLGKRTADLAADGRVYSRALQADTTYYYVLQCSPGAASGTFKTATVAAGASGPDPFPFSKYGFGNYGYPDIDFLNRSKPYIDPQTGVLLKRITDFANGNTESVPALPAYEIDDLSHSWDSPELGLTSDGLFASYGGPGGEEQALFVMTPPPSNTDRGYMDIPSNYLDDIQLLVKGRGDAMSQGDRTINMCLTVNHGYSCVGSTVSLVLPLGGAAEVAAPNDFPHPYLGGWGGPNINVDQLQVNFSSFGTVDVSGQIASNTTPPLFGAVPYTFPTSIDDPDRSWTTKDLTGADTHTKHLHIKLSGSAPTCPNNDCLIHQLIDHNHIALAGF